ncbi:DinB family protein [Nocardioides ungokensis]|uniref:DinB family protein n=1 Tax=Nocardioides ungokensis TaxID=1643322 RepID=UPI0015DF54F7|nr:DinB family protein [Nocardioides ungokensis]
MSAEPRPGLGGELEHVSAYLDFYRDTCLAKCRSLPEQELRRPLLPSGWTPLELLWHLAHMERRWFVWGFLGEQVDEPWGDSGGAPDNRWQVAPDVGLDDVVALLEAGAARTREVLSGHEPETVAATGGRFSGEEPPDLRWICFHVLQEYARHAGHLDIVVELEGGPTGE